MFFIQENVAFNLSVTQSIPTSNEQLMKTKLHTFAHKQILRKHIKKLVKNDSGLKITAGQRTMSGLIADLTGQTLVLPVNFGCEHFFLLLCPENF